MKELVRFLGEHRERGIAIRTDLYERAVRLLLAHWNNRIVRDELGNCIVQ